MEDDAIDAENDLLDFDDSIGDDETFSSQHVCGTGSLSDIEIDYETRSEISGDDEADTCDVIKSALGLPKEAGKEDKCGQEKSSSSMDAIKTTEREASFTKNSMNDSSGSSKRARITEQKSKSRNSDREDPMVQPLLHDARFFLMKTSDANNLKVSQERNVWFTDPQNVAILDSALKASKNLILIFSAKWTGLFSGFALVTGRSKSDDPPRDWAPAVKTLGGSFHVKWLSKKELLFSSSSHLTNPSTGKLLSLFSDGQEINGKLGLDLCQLLLHEGSGPKVSTDQRKDERPVKPQRENGRDKSRTSDHTLNGSKHDSSTPNELYDTELLGLRPDISRERSRSRNIRTYSPARHSDRRRTPEYRSNRSRSPRPLRRFSGDNSAPTSRSRTVENYRSRKSSRRESRVLDLRCTTSQGQNLRGRDSFDKTDHRSQSPNKVLVDDTYLSDDCRSSEPSPGKSENALYGYQSHGSYEDIVSESAEPERIAGRLVIERSPIRETVASPVVHSDFPPNDFVVKSGYGDEGPSTMMEIAPETFERSVSYEKVTVSGGTSKTPRVVYETHESLTRSDDMSQVSLRNNSSHQLTGVRLLTSGRSLNNSIERSSSQETTRKVYVYRESNGRSRTQRSSSSLRRSRSRAVSSGYSSQLVTTRNGSRTSQSPHRPYKSREPQESLSRDRPPSARSSTHESSRVRSLSYGSSQNRSRKYQEPTERFLNQNNSRHSYNRRAEGSPVTHRSRNSERYNERYSESKSYKEKSPLHNRVSEKKRGDLHWGDRSVISRDEQSSADQECRRSTVPSTVPRGRHGPPPVESSHMHSRSTQMISASRYYPERGDRGRIYDDQRSISDPTVRRSAVPSTVPNGHDVQPGTIRFPAGSRDYPQSSRPPVLPQVSPKPFDSVVHPSFPKFNPAIKPPPVPSKYVDGVPPKYYQSTGVWSQGQKSPPANLNLTPTHHNISAEEFIKFCNMNKPMRAIASARHRRS